MLLVQPCNINHWPHAEEGGGEKCVLVGQLTKSERVNSTKSKAEGSSRPLLSR